MSAWKTVDLGTPRHQGEAVAAGTGWNLTAGGEDMWEGSDHGHFAFTERSGDLDLVVRVEAMGATHLYTKAGLMVREGLDAGSAHVFHLVFPTNAVRNNNNGGYESQVRPAAGALCHAYYPPKKGIGDPEFPVAFPQVWLRLTRKGDQWTAWAGSDGTHWTEYARFPLALSNRVLVGVAATAHDDAKTVQVKFRDLVGF